MIKVITNEGTSLIARQLAGETLSFTSVKIGTGTVADGEDTLAFTALKSQVKSADINSLAVISSKICQVEAVYSNEGFTERKGITEFGIYAKIGTEEEKLYCYIYAPELIDYMPAYSTDTFTNRIKRFNLEVGTATTVTITVDESAVYVTQAQFKRDSTNSFKAVMASRMFG